MDPGMLALGAIFALAGALFAWSVARGRAIARRLLEAGFVACDAEAPALLRALQELAGGHPPAARRVYEVGRCFKRPGGWGMLYRFAVVDKTNDDSHRGRDSRPRAAASTSTCSISATLSGSRAVRCRSTWRLPRRARSGASS